MSFPDPAAPAAQPTLAGTLPDTVFRREQAPALFWFSTPHTFDIVYPPAAESRTLGTQQMVCSAPRKPVSRCFAPPSPRQ